MIVHETIVLLRMARKTARRQGNMAMVAEVQRLLDMALRG